MKFSGTTRHLTRGSSTSSLTHLGTLGTSSLIPPALPALLWLFCSFVHRYLAPKKVLVLLTQFQCWLLS